MAASTSPLLTLRVVTTWRNVFAIVVNPIASYANLVYTVTHLEENWPVSRACFAVAYLGFSFLFSIAQRSAVESQLHNAGYVQQHSRAGDRVLRSNFAIAILWWAYIGYSRTGIPSVMRRDFIAVFTGLLVCWVGVSMAVGPALFNTMRPVPSRSSESEEKALQPARDDEPRIRAT